MSDKSYTSVLRRACLKLLLILSHYLHLGRVTAPAQLELEEVNGRDTRALGNWKQDVFGSCYSTQLPLPAMRVMAGHDKRQGFHINPRTTYYGEDRHSHLPKLIFPWLEEAIAKTDQIRNKTAAAFLSFVESLRWVIIQDAAVLISEGRQHYIFEQNGNIFNTEEFKDYQTKLLQHIEQHERDEKFNATLDSVLPGLHQKLDNQMFAMNNHQQTLTNVSNRIHGVIKNYDDFKAIYLEEQKKATQDVKTLISCGISDLKESVDLMVGSHVKGLCEHIGNYPGRTNQESLSQRNDNIRQGGDLNIQSTHADKTIVIRDNIVDNNSRMENIELSSLSDRVKLNPTLSIYKIPALFPTFGSMLNHWYCDVKKRNTSSDKRWRSHLSKSEKKRFQRLSRIIAAFRQQLSEGITMIDAEAKFEEYYANNKKSLAYLSDIYAKGILDRNNL